MGRRGPQRGQKYRKRILIAPHLPVRTDGELVRAQHTNERIERFLQDIESGDYPARALDGAVVAQVIEATEILQEAIIAGIEDYVLGIAPRASAPAPVAAPAPQGLPD